MFPINDIEHCVLQEGALINAVMILLNFGLPIMYLLYWQQVLPGYRWDVKAACDKYLAAEYSLFD